MRLFFWLKANFPKNFMLDEEKTLQMREFFSRYEVEKHLAYLKKNLWVTTDKSGRHYLQGRNFFCVRYGMTAKYYRVFKTDPSVTEDRAAWRDFVFGAAVSIVARNIKVSVKSRERRRFASSNNVGGDGSEGSRKRGGSVPVSLCRISANTGVAKSTASKMRKRAAEAGHVTSEQQFVKFTSPQKPDGICLSRREWLEARGHFAEHHGAKDAAKIVWRKGMLFIQLPNLVSTSMRAGRQRTPKGVPKRAMFFSSRLADACGRAKR